MRLARFRALWLLRMKNILSNSRLRPILVLVVLALAFWSRVLFTGRVLLPGEMLSGFLPFGNNPGAPWTILQWDSLAQYFPWRHFAAEQLHAGKIPLWNPYQFTGTPFVANAQSAVFYPLNWPFWCFDTAYAFGIAALEHTLLAMLGTFVLCRRWGMSRAASVVSATAYAFCGYLAAWALLPTLFATASWLPVCLWLFEKASDDKKSGGATLALVLALWCALLAGHAQIFFYILLGLAVRQPFLKHKLRGLMLWIGSTALALLVGAGQLFPTLELARLGHRAGGPATASDWAFWLPRALHVEELASLVVPFYPMSTGTLNENFGYIGIGVVVLAALGLAARDKSQRYFALTLGAFGLLYAMATPVAKLFFFGVPGISQMGGTGRALLLWSMGAALLAGFGVDWLRARVKSAFVPVLALLVVGAELSGNAWLTQPTAPREQIYPKTTLTDWLKTHSNAQNRVLFYTPQGMWLPSEGFRAPRTHPVGVLPPNGATVYGLYDVNGYDSLSPRAYHQWVASDSPQISPILNGNMVLLNNLRSEILDSLLVRYVVVPQNEELGANTPTGQIVYSADGCNVWERPLPAMGTKVSGAAFYPGWKDGGYNPETFRFGAFISLCALGFVAAGLTFKWRTASRSTENSTLQEAGAL